MQWRSDIPAYGKVKYSQIYPGVDLVFYGNQRQLDSGHRIDTRSVEQVVDRHYATQIKRVASERQRVSEVVPRVGRHRQTVAGRWQQRTTAGSSLFRGDDGGGRGGTCHPSRAASAEKNATLLPNFRT